jgi:hypothetical protein
MRLNRIKLIPVAIISLVILLIGLTPVSAVVDCSDATTVDGYDYSLVVDPCSTSGIPPQEVNATATTNDPTEITVRFIWTDPLGGEAFREDVGYVEVNGDRVFTSSLDLDTVGEWVITAGFAYGEPGEFELQARADVTVLVVNEYAIGTVAATLAALTGLVAYTRFRRPKIIK